ncbi:DUF1707 and DUF4870 domain-containing protein [Actinopolymorpha sp. B17G11]|uniref:DUF1707 and DUF4870 domain-containing protein n=1 Tax=unclassified Actinopolymorpha TaxID=2627063 RepID=UPI0032D913A9
MSQPPPPSRRDNPLEPTAQALRVSDEEREQAVQMVQNAYAEGRIDHSELDHRVGEALNARDRSDLSGALRGLPPAPQRTATRSAGVPAPGPDASPPAPSGSERLWALAAHWSGIFTLFVVPALIAMTKGRTSEFVRTQAWEAANFQLTFIGANIAVGMATAFTFGLAGLLFVPLAMVWLVLTGMGGLSAAVGNRWRYPWNVRVLGGGH